MADFLQNVKQNAKWILEDVRESFFQRNWHVYGYITEEAKNILKKHRIGFSDERLSDTGLPYVRVDLSGKRIEYKEIEDDAFFVFPDNDLLVIHRGGLGYLDGRKNVAEYEIEYDPNGVLIE